jgi:DNA polymerase-3 subunit gamma/tau
LEQMALLLQAVAMEQAVPGSSGADDQDSESLQALAGAWAPDETQLAYSVVLHGRSELSLLADEYAAFTMVMLRFLAFPPGPQAQPNVSRSAPLRSPSPPAIAVPVPSPAPQRLSPLSPALTPALTPAAASSTASTSPQEPTTRLPTAQDDPALADRWEGLVRRLDEAGKISGLTRELAWQAGLVSVGAGSPAVWTLRVEHEALRTPALQDKLSEALGQALEVSVSLELVAGVPADTPARRQAAERARRQQAAEQLIRQDPAVVELLQQFKTAKVVPGSIKPR